MLRKETVSARGPVVFHEQEKSAWDRVGKGNKKYINTIYIPISSLDKPIGMLILLLVYFDLHLGARDQSTPKKSAVCCRFSAESSVLTALALFWMNLGESRCAGTKGTGKTVTKEFT